MKLMAELTWKRRCSQCHHPFAEPQQTVLVDAEGHMFCPQHGLTDGIKIVPLAELLTTDHASDGPESASYPAAPVSGLEIIEIYEDEHAESGDSESEEVSDATTEIGDGDGVSSPEAAEPPEEPPTVDRGEPAATTKTASRAKSRAKKGAAGQPGAGAAGASEAERYPQPHESLAAEAASLDENTDYLATDLGEL